VKTALKVLAWLIVLGGLAGLAVRAGYLRYLEKLKARSSAPTDPAAAEPLRVVCQRVVPRDIRQVASLTGTLRAMAEVRVMSKVSGRLDELRLADGTPVDEGLVVPKKGARLAVVDHEAFEAQVKQAEAALAAARAEEAKVKAGARPQELDIARANAVAAQSAIQTARTAVAQAQAALVNATSEVERMRNLHRDHVVAKQQLDAAEAQYTIAKEKHEGALQQVKSAEEGLKSASAQLALTEEGARLEDRAAIAAKVQQAEATLRLAKVSLAESTIEAPIAGVVAVKHLDEGNMVAPTVPIVTLVDIDTVKVTVGVNERDISLVQAGKTKATVRADAYAGEAFEGVVEKVSPVADERTRTVGVEIHVPNPRHRLKPGMFARVDLLLREKKGVPAIPEHAVAWQEDQPFVVVVNDGKAHRRPVKLGLAEGPVVEVAEGLEAGALVVTHGQQGLKDGDRVAAEEEKTR